MYRLLPVFTVVWAFLLSACVTTSMQGYADKDPPAKPVRSIAAYVAAPLPLATSVQSSINEEAKKRRIIAQDALQIFPPTRTYTNAEIRKDLRPAALMQFW